MDQLQVVLSRVQSVPLDYVVPNAQEIEPLAINAVFDGSAAGGAFLPALEIISDSDHVVARCIGASVAAGAVAEVTFAPFLRAAAAAGGSGIQFDTAPQVGDWLDIEVSGSDPSGNGLRIDLDTAPLSIFDQSASGDGSFQLGPGVLGGGLGGILLSTGANGIKVFTGSGTLQILAGSGTLTVGENNGNLAIGVGVGYDGADGVLLAAALGKILELQHLRHRTTVGAAGVAAALPATPTAYLEVDGLSVPAYDIS